MSSAARPVSYERWDASASNYASRTMRWSGPLLLLFIVYHIMHLTLGNAHPSFNTGDVYTNVVNGFRVWYVSAFYIVAMLALCLHLYHGVWSMFQTLGWNTPKYDSLLRRISAAFAILVAIGNISVPVGVLTGIIS
jgi:succinate dehydrogenase / fumarate reductase cytochrome b subunit